MQPGALLRDDPDLGRVPGLILLHLHRTQEQAEVGVWRAPAASGAGRAAAAVRLLLGWVRRETGLHRIEPRIPSENAAAPAIGRRLGFTREGLLRHCAIERGACSSLEQWSLPATDEAAARR